MSRKGLELNGVSNILLLMGFEIDKETKPDGNIYYMNEETFTSIMRQLDFLERYMLACSDANVKGEDLPFWHDITQNPKLFPLVREKYKK